MSYTQERFPNKSALDVRHPGPFWFMGRECGCGHNRWSRFGLCTHCGGDWPHGEWPGDKE